VSKEWFVYSQSIVAGPFTTDEVQADVSAGRWTNDCFVWWKGQREWMPLTNWRAQVSKILMQEKHESSQVWYIDNAGTPVGPLTRSEMLDGLRSVSKYNKVRLWTVGFDKWTNIFDLHDLMDELGLSRREHARAPVMGTVAVTHMGSDSTTLAMAASISTAGMGLNSAGFLTKGEDLQLLVKCNELGQLHLQGSVAYVTPQGYAGIRFANVSPELQSIIFDYVKRFQTPAQKAAPKTA
jgi:hypothetical protein